MTAYRLVWLSCNGVQNGEPCDANTMSDFYIAGVTPSTVKEAEAYPTARRWRRRPDGRHLCPDCWKDGQR